jgi:hypothetical protein
MNASVQEEDLIVVERDMRDESRRLQQQWHSWASPVGLGIGMLGIVGGFALLAFGLTLLSSI